MTGTDDAIVKRWREGGAKIAPVRVEGDISLRIVDDVLLLAFENGLPNIFVKPGKPVLAGSDVSMVPVTDRILTPFDTEQFFRFLYTGGNPVSEMNQGKPLDFRYDMRHVSGEYISFRGQMKRIDGVGDQYAAAIRPLGNKIVDWGSLGIEDGITDNLMPERGLVLFVGRTDSGKTTLQASAIKYVAENCVGGLKIEEYGIPAELLQDDRNWPNVVYVPNSLGVTLRPDAEWKSGLMSFGCSNAMRCAPNLLVISEARDDPTFRAMVESSQTGQVVFATAHTPGPAQTIARIVLASHGSERESFAFELLDSLHMIVHQKLLQGASGGRVGVREFLIFDDQVKQALRAVPYSSWIETVREIMSTADGVSAQRMDQALNRAFDAGYIDEDVYVAALAGKKVMRRRLNAT